METELRLGLPGSVEVKKPRENPQKRGSPDFRLAEDDNHDKPSRKVQLVGWPPVRSYMKNSFQSMKNKDDVKYVKVSMDGAPYLRKVDLKNCKGYKELREALENLFGCFSSGEILRMDGKYTLEHTIAYEDKDGDLMLLGDVPWEILCIVMQKVENYDECIRKQGDHEFRMMYGSHIHGQIDLCGPVTHVLQAMEREIAYEIN